ncbi:putative disease resistance protein At4g19050 isoform X2 [Silene latifolia]|uniref:putative disease resistance protein At4g19050 isoform X2 n=1 Tax=Silene latifolia TaxID=37657 RepID=UPI003D784930
MELFYNLCHLEVSNLEKLAVLLPVNPLPRKMTTLNISNCHNLTYIFSEVDEVNKESDIIKLPCLKMLALDMVSNLMSVIKESNKDNNDDSRRPSFFNSKVTLTSLEELSLNNNGRIVKLWDMESKLQSFLNLKVLKISDCSEMETIGPPSMFFSLVQLESLSLNACGEMKQVISDGSERDEIPKEIIAFPKLKRLQISCMDKLKCFCGGSYKMVFPRLEVLSLHNLSSMTKFAGGTSSTGFFPKTLRSLTLRSALNMEVTSLHPFTNLRDLSIYNLTWEYMFSTNGGVEHLQSLEKLTIEDCPKLKAIIPRGDKDNTIVFPRLKILYLSNLKSMIKLCSISDIPFHFPSLKDLSIVACNKLEWHLDGEPNQVVELPSLENVTIDACDAMTSFSTRPLKAPKLRELTVHNCLKMEWFLLGNSNNNADLELPSLEEVTIEVCPEMKSFSPAFLRAPRLQLVKIDGKLYPITENEDLNHFLQSANSSEQIAADENDL